MTFDNPYLDTMNELSTPESMKSLAPNTTRYLKDLQRRTQNLRKAPNRLWPWVVAGLFAFHELNNRFYRNE